MSRVPSNDSDDDFAVEITSLDPSETTKTVPDSLLEGSHLAPRVRTWLTVLSVLGGLLLIFVVLSPVLSSLLLKKTSIPPVFHSPVQVQNVAVQGNVAYVSSSDGMWRAFRVKDGSLLWQRKLPEVTPIFLQNIMYLYYYDQQFYTIQALRISDGTTLWKFQISSSDSIPVIIDNGVAHALSNNPYNQGPQQGKTLMALDARTGSELWHYSVNTPSSSNIDVEGMQDKIYITTSSLDQTPTIALFVLRSNDGLPLWHYKNPRAPQTVSSSYLYSFNPSSTSKGLVYITPGDDVLKAFNANNGHEVWHYTPTTIADSTEPPPVMGTNLFYVQTIEGPLKAIRADNGTVAWTYKDPWGVATVFSETNGVLYFKAGDGFIVALRASDGKLLWRVQPITSPFTVDSLWIEGDTAYTFTQIGNDTYAMIAALRLKDGRRLWQRKVDISSNSMFLPQMTNDQLLVDFGDTVTALRATDGAVLWHVSQVQSDLQYSWPLTFIGNVALLHLSSGVLEAHQVETGAVLWRYPRSGTGK